MSDNYYHIKKRINKSAAQLAQLDFITKEISMRMLSRLDYIKICPQHVLDMGFGTGIDRIGLKQYYPKANIYSVDIALNLFKQHAKKSGWLRHEYKDLLCANMLQLPIAAQSMDLVWSNLSLSYITDIKQYFAEISRVLKLGATFLVSGLGVDSLMQLRNLGLLTYNFPDIHLIGDILVELGFSNPVTDLEYITLEYDTLDELLSDIRLVGCGAGLNNYLGKSGYANLQKRFDQISNSGKFPLTLEIFYAHAWKDRVRRDLVSGRSVINFYRNHD